MNIYINRDNKTIFNLLQDGEAVTANTITRAVFRFGDFCVDTNVAGDPIELIENATKVQVQAGLIPGLVEGGYEGKLTIFDTLSDNGFAWGRAVKIKVILWPICE